jgi:nicotinate-nucleotide--dimethylbenzimidazole phosphoribosyltransferase
LVKECKNWANNAITIHVSIDGFFLILQSSCSMPAGTRKMNPMTEPFNGLPFGDIKYLLQKMPDFNVLRSDAAKEHQQNLIASAHDHGRLSHIATWLAGWQGRVPSIRRPELCLFAGATDLNDAPAMLAAQAAAKLQIVLLSSGGSAANSLAQSGSVGLRVFDLAVDQPGQLISAGPAMSERGCMRAFAFGMEAVAANADLLCLAGFGPGSRVTASTIAMGLFGGAASDWSDDWLPLIQTANDLHGNCNQDPLELLRCCGSREIAAICGAIVAARTQSIPVIIDGFVATVAAAVLATKQPGATDHILLSGSDGSPAHDRLIAQLSLDPLLDLKIRSSDGLGALLAAQLVRAAADLHTDLPSATQLPGLMEQAANPA